jgi:uncharacterized protein (TIGR02466 family)
MAAQDGSWIENSDVLSLFPTLVWQLQLKAERHEPIDAAILGALRDLRRSSPTLAPGEAWQSVRTLHDRTELVGLIACIDDSVSRILRFLKIGYHAVHVTGCWANVSTKGASHGIHSHPNNFLSGVYYVQTQTGADTINFHDPRPQTSILRPPVTELTAHNTDQVVVRVRNGTLLLFPSYLPHSVSPNVSEAERISVSFNVMFSSFAETLGKPLW